MEIGDRFVLIQQTLGLKKQDLAKTAHITSASISTICSGKNNPSAQTISLICSEYGINENWLRTGDGEMFAPKSRADEIAEITAALTKDRDPRKIYFAKLAAELTEEQLEMLNTMALGFLDAVDKNKKSTQ